MNGQISRPVDDDFMFPIVHFFISCCAKKGVNSMNNIRKCDFRLVAINTVSCR